MTFIVISGIVSGEGESLDAAHRLAGATVPNDIYSGKERKDKTQVQNANLGHPPKNNAPRTLLLLRASMMRVMVRCREQRGVRVRTILNTTAYRFW
jgi:hypothetical protein